MITISVDSDEEERTMRRAFADGTLSAAVRMRFKIMRGDRVIGGMEAPLIERGPRETYISAPRPSGTIIIREASPHVPLRGEAVVFGGTNTVTGCAGGGSGGVRG